MCEHGLEWQVVMEYGGRARSRRIKRCLYTHQVMSRRVKMVETPKRKRMENVGVG